MAEGSDDEFPDLLAVFEKHGPQRTALRNSDKTSKSGMTPGSASSTKDRKLERKLGSLPFDLESAAKSKTDRPGSPKKDSSKRRVLNKIYDNPLLRPFGNGNSSTASSELLQNRTNRSEAKVVIPKLKERKQRSTLPMIPAPRTDEDEVEEDSSALSDFIVSDSSYIDEEYAVTRGSPSPPRVRKRLVQRKRLIKDEDQGLEKSGDVRVEVSSKHASIISSFTPDENRSIESRNEADLSDIDERLGILHFSPQTNRSPKKMNIAETPSTPPLSPQKPSKLLASPTKTPRIPSTPHRPSMDAFWSQELINDWNDRHSPTKSTKSMRAAKTDGSLGLGLDFLSETPKKSPLKKDQAVKEAKKVFAQGKHEIADSFLRELDETITEGKISEMASSTGGVKIIWSKKLNTTAGRANWKRETTREKLPSALKQSGSVGYRHFASIELAEKVIDDESRLLNVIAHEFCHLANFMISGVKNNPHGREFKAWAAKCSARFGHRGIEVTTRHSYSIEYKYVWKCINCGIEFKRHSKSIDPSRHQCGSCKSKLVQTKPVPRTNVGASEYQMYVKANMKRIMNENPGSPQKDIMAFVGRSYREAKAEKEVTQSNVSGQPSTRKPDVEDVVQKLDLLDLTNP